MKVSKKVLSLVMLSLALSAVSGEAKAAEHDLIRIKGSNRYETAISLSKKLYKNSKNIILASGENFADALAGGQLSSSVDAPILLVEKNSVSNNTINEIKRLNPEKIYILGGNGAVSGKVLDIVKKSTNTEVERISGQNRFETALKIAEISRKNGKTKDTVIANGYRFPDALSGSGIVANSNKSMILTDGKNLPEIEMGEKTILGGKSTVSEEIKGTRISGKDRYETSLKIAKSLYPNPENVILVSGENYPDALSAVSLSKKEKAPVILIKKDEINKETKEYIEKAKKITVVGGESSISEKAVANINSDKDTSSSSSSGGSSGGGGGGGASSSSGTSSTKPVSKEDNLKVKYDTGDNKIETLNIKKGEKLSTVLKGMQEKGGIVKKGYYGTYSVDGKDIDLNTYVVEKDIAVKQNWHKVDDEFIKNLKVPEGEYKVVFKWEDGTENVAITKNKQVIDLYRLGVSKDLPIKENQKVDYYVNGEKYEYDETKSEPIYFKVDKDSVIKVKTTDIENGVVFYNDVTFKYDRMYSDNTFLRNDYTNKAILKDLSKKVETLVKHEDYKKGQKIDFPKNIETELLTQDGWIEYIDGDTYPEEKKVDGDRFSEKESTEFYANIKEKTQNVEVNYIRIGKNGEEIVEKTTMNVGKINPMDEILSKASIWRDKNKKKFQTYEKGIYENENGRVCCENTSFSKVGNEYVSNFAFNYEEQEKINTEIRKSGKYNVYFTENYRTDGYYYNSIGDILGIQIEKFNDQENIVVPNNIGGVKINKIVNMIFDNYKRKEFKKLIIGEGIEKVSGYAFNQENLEDRIYFDELVLPNSLKEIGYRGFLKLPIGAIKFGNGDLKIGDEAFAMYKDSYEKNDDIVNALSGVVYIPENVKYIGKDAFKGTKVEKFIVTDDAKYSLYWNRMEEGGLKYFPIEHEKVNTENVNNDN